MKLALEQAALARDEKEIPVGCIIADADGKIIGRGRNRCESSRNPLAHAELEAISEACASLGDWRLVGCTLFVTLEPCPMCAGAIINARIGTVVFSAREPNSGSCGSILNLFEENFGHHPAIYGGVLEAECQAILSDFFKRLREQSPPPQAPSE